MNREFSVWRTLCHWTAILGLSLLPWLSVMVHPVLGQNSTDTFLFHLRREAIPLTVSTEAVAVRFTPRLTRYQMSTLVASEPSLQPLAAGQEIPETGLFLLRARQGTGKRDILRLLASLNAREHVAFANPVFQFPGAQQTVADEFIVRFRADAPPHAIAGLNADHGVKPVKQLAWAENTYVLQVTTGRQTLEVANRYVRSGLVDYAEPNWIRLLTPPSAPDDDHYPEQWGMENTGINPPGGAGTADADIDAEAAWAVSSGSPDIVIAVLDEGIDLGHEDLDAKIVAHYSALPDDANSAAPNNTWDAHGTACAGIAVAESNNSQGVSGVCQGCSLMAVQIAYSAYPGGPWVASDSWIADGLTWAVDHGADVLSNSWGGGFPASVIDDAIHYAVTQGRDGLGAVVLCAAGNNNSSPPIYPASNDETLAVGATSPCDERKSPTSCDGESWWGSNYGSQLDLVAPGVQWWSSDMTGSAGYSAGDYFDHMNGTSSATPTAAGLAGLVLSANPRLHQSQVRAIMENSADDQVGRPDEDMPGWDMYMGWGRINAAKALTMVQASAASGQGTLDGTVSGAIPSAASGPALAGIDITAERVGGGASAATTDSGGYYTMTLASGTYTITAQAALHADATATGVAIFTDTHTVQDFQLVPKGLLYGYVSDARDGSPLQATVAVDEVTAVSAGPDTGYYEIHLDAGTYAVSAAAANHANQTVAITVAAGTTAQQDFELLPTCWVRLNDDADYPTVQAAVDASTRTTDVVKVAGYCADINHYGNFAQVAYISKTLTLRGGYTVTNWITSDPVANPTTLDAQGQGRVLYITDPLESAQVITPTIEGLTITGGDAGELPGGPGGGQGGGGVYVNGAAPKLRHNVVFSNTTCYHGGGVYLSCSEATLEGNFVTSNTASYGAGMYVADSSATLTGNTITTNIASARGGGLYVANGTSQIAGNTVLSNTATYYGGGLYVSSGTDIVNDNTFAGNTSDLGGGVMLLGGAATLTDNAIYFNQASYGGGAYWMSSSGSGYRNMVTSNSATGYGGGLSLDRSPVTLSANVILSNTARYGGGLELYRSMASINGDTVSYNVAQTDGGGLYLRDHSDARLANSIITSNEAGDMGSGISVHGSSPQLLHTTIARNLPTDRPDDGIGIYVGAYGSTRSTVALTNTILANQAVGIKVLANNTATLEGTLWYQNGLFTEGDGTILTGTMNSYGDPFFVDDYHVGLSSAAIDVGVPTSLDTDVDGEPRPLGQGPDLGADEYGGPDLTATVKTASSATVRPGETLTYTISLRNTGPGNAQDVFLTDSIPTAARYVPGSAWASAGTLRVADPITWTGPVLVGEPVTVSFSVTVHLSASAGTVITNTAAVSASQLVAPLTRTATSLIRPYRMWVQPPTVETYVGHVFTMDIAADSGTLELGEARAVVSFDPDYLRVVDDKGQEATSIIPGVQFGRNELHNTVDQLTGRIEYAAGSVEALEHPFPRGELVLAKIRFRAIAGTVPDTAVRLVTAGDQPRSMLIARTDDELALEGTEGIIRVLDMPRPDLSTSTKTVDSSYAAPGQTLTYTIYLNNTGSEHALSTRLVDPIPAHTTYVAGSAAASAGIFSELDPISWTGRVSVGVPVTVSFSVRVGQPLTNGTIITNAAVISDPTVMSPVTVQAHTVVRDIAPLAVTHTPAVTAVAGNPLSLTATITGGEQQPIVAVHYRVAELTDFLSTTMTFVGEASYEGTIPASAVVLPGLDYYVSASDRESTVTHPRTGTHHVRVVFGGDPAGQVFMPLIWRAD